MSENNFRPYIVAKFGGTSVSSVEKLKNIAEIVKNHTDIKVIVVSATAGTTNNLVEMGYISTTRERISQLYEEIKQRHYKFADELDLNKDQRDSLDKILHSLGELTGDYSQPNVENSKVFRARNAKLDYLYSFGERLSSYLVTCALNNYLEDVDEFKEVVCLDARKIMRTNEEYTQAKVKPEVIELLSDKYLIPLIEDKKLVITQGFVGETREGMTTTLGRGGSDLSAAIIAEALNCKQLQIWTDVAGIYTTDPRIASGAKQIPRISFAEATELANFGAKVLHPETLKPVMRKKIDVFVGSTSQSSLGGTTIIKKDPDAKMVRAIALRRRQILLTASSLSMVDNYGFLAKLFDSLASMKISIDIVTTSEVSVSLTFDGDKTFYKDLELKERVLRKLSEFCDIKVEEDLSLVAIVGNDLSHTAGLSGGIFNQLKDFNIRLICHGASNNNLCFLVNENEAEDVVRSLHKKFLD